MPNLLASKWSQASDDCNFPAVFVSNKHNINSQTRYTVDPAARQIESQITLIELDAALFRIQRQNAWSGQCHVLPTAESSLQF